MSRRQDAAHSSARMTLVVAALPHRRLAPDRTGFLMPTQRAAALRDRDWLAGRLAMGRAFRLHTGDARRPSPHTLVAYRPNGQPCLRAAPALYCSIAHSHGWAIAGISSRPIGVDIEKIRRHHPALLSSVALPDEISRVAAYVADPDHLVTVLWTMKEAVMKATGVALGIPLRRVRVNEFDGRSARVTVTATNVFPAEFRVTSFRHGLYFLSIARLERDNDIPRVNWHQPGRLPAPRSAHTG